MAQLAIKGHATRWREVIELLEMLGGKNICHYSGNCDVGWYFIDDDKDIGCSQEFTPDSVFISYSIKEFLEKFPYKVGDKVKLDYWPCTIQSMEWDEYKNTILYTVRGFDFCKCVYSEDLQPYKEETMEEIRIDIPNRYEFFGINDDNQIVLTKKQPQYPKTYEECCKVLGYSGNYNMILTTDVDNKLFNALYRLKVCRDAYWKIAGEEMGLGKPWEPDFDNPSTNIEYHIKIVKGCFTYSSRVFAFPTEEMQDAFYENFKDLIEECCKIL